MSASDILSRRILRDGPVSVAEFMATALLHPRYGYYAQCDDLRRDFVTSPEIHPMFGEMLAVWCVDYWQRAGRPDPFILAELGPGSGTLMQDLLHGAEVMEPRFRKAANVWFVETSQSMRLRVRERVPGARFVHDAGNLPQNFIVAIANEFLDALPMRQFVSTTLGWEERLVDWNAQRSTFTFISAGSPSPMASVLPPSPEEGLIAEISPAQHSVIAGMAAHVRLSGGVALFLDYGRDDTEPAGTLQAIRGHGRHDPLAHPGSVDLSARVDFDALARTARAGGARTFGPIAQRDFLLALGIRERADQVIRSASEREQNTRSALDRLTAGHAMGTRFRAMATAWPSPPAGFPV